MENNIQKDIFFYKNLSYWRNQIPNDKNLKLYIDPLFPPNTNSILGKNENGEYINKIDGEKNEKKLNKLSIKWLRVGEIFKDQKYYLFKDQNNINISYIKQGKIADCYFISSIIGLAKEYNKIYKLFKIKEINPQGYYEIILFIDGQFQIVIIDDFLPVLNNNELCFSKSSINEIWICLLEKAWAKINGGYSNIIKGFAHHSLEALTGFPCLNLMHSSYDYQYIYNYLFNNLKYIYIITGTSKNDIKDSIIECNHCYALIGNYIIDNNTIIKLRDPRGNKIQNDKSFLISEKNKKELNKEIEDGIVYISFEDYYKYFSFTNICFIMNNCYSQKFKIEKNEIYKGNIFNIYLEKDGILSINLIKKNWIYNRENGKSIIPSFLCLVKYNSNDNKTYNINDNKKIFFSDYFSNINSEDNTNLINELKHGYYLVYSYIDNYHSNSNYNQFYYLKFDSNVNFKIIKRPCDIKENNFPILKNIKIQEYLLSNNINNFTKQINYIIKYKNRDLEMKIIYNSNNKWLKVTEDISDIKNILLLGSYKIVNNIFDWFIPPKKCNILLGMIIDSSKEGSFNLKSKNFLIKSIPIYYKDYEINLSQYAQTIFK